MMLSESVQAFNDKVAASPELRAQLRAVTNPMEFLALAKTEGFDPTFRPLDCHIRNNGR